MDHDTSAWGEIISLDKQISSTGYCHMICLNDWQSVKVGNYLNAGTVLGWVGTSGLSSGYHLHFTLRIFSEGGNVVTDDPFPHLLSWCGMYDEMKEYERIKLESRGIEIPIHGIGENRG
jgi:murein DD-endopeptidase MepM/ murein hydrolase activator NlpD